LEQLIASGEMAKQIRHAFDANGHRPKEIQKLKELGQQEQTANRTELQLLKRY
jgi:hypothetical protein